ncbi:hypothetical protein LTR37_001143 [Vermiconidia calcicola]|uniref:Uncharacterized protein n=1 Tax=Vermiconidia calcicola TaxID=1690605 RepID=A0ACC3NXB4_9PEZI|nr:hypothetical protein LTR37_001143 [Vermiconidia calcicola]
MYMYAVTTAVLAFFPLLATSVQLQARDEWQPSATSLVCLYMTNGVNWTGEGLNICSVGGICANELPDGLTANVTSAGPADGQACFLYSEVNCTGTRSAPLMAPGYADLGEIGFERMARSWRCWKLCWYMPGSGNSFGVGADTSTTSSSAALISPKMNTPTTNGAAAVADTNGAVSITKTLGGPTASGASSSSNAALTHMPSPFGSPSLAPTADSTSTTSSPQPTTTIPAMPTPPGLGSITMFSTLTHTYADGSTTVFTTGIVEPIPPTSTLA